jgi:hypothetical protein
MNWCDTMRLATITLITALGLGTVSMTTAGMAFGNHSGLADRAFGHPRFHKTFVIPYPYYDYDYPIDESGDYQPPVVVPPPPSPTPSACHRSEETFTVPSEGGGTRQITITNCP